MKTETEQSHLNWCLSNSLLQYVFMELTVNVKADLVLLVLLVLAWEFSRSQTVASGKTWEKLLVFFFITIPVRTMCVCNEFFVIHIKLIVPFLHDFMLILDKDWLLVEVNISPPLWSFSLLFLSISQMTMMMAKLQLSPCWKKAGDSLF